MDERVCPTGKELSANRIDASFMVHAGGEFERYRLV